MMPKMQKGTGVQASIIRALDIVFSTIGLIVTSPLFPVIGVLIKLNSKGPLFFPAERVGKDMRLFPMYKFRTMMEKSSVINQSICPQYDPRVTTVGRLLRRTKLNELPQLLNILKGDMSFVGPRPEAPDLAELYPEDAKMVFTVKPGLVGPAVISLLKGDVSGRNEEELYPPGVDPKRYYIEHILPEKVKIDLYHLSHQTVGSYLKIIFAAVRETVLGAFSAKQADQSKRQIYLFIADFVLGQVTFAFAYLLYIQRLERVPSFGIFISGLLMIVIVRPVLNYVLGLYSFIIELMTRRDLYRVPISVGLGSLFMLILNAFHRMYAYPLRVAVVDFCLLNALLMGVRLFIKVRYQGPGKRLEPDLRPRVVIFGANKHGLRALHALGGSRTSPYKVVGFIDDSEEKYAKKIGGLKVLGNRHHIQALSVLHNVQEVILALDDKARNDIDEVAGLCARAGIRSRIFSGRMEDETAGRFFYPLRSLHISDMLPEVEVSLDETGLKAILPGKTVLMFGSGGELGSAICRYIFNGGCRKIVIVDRYESRLSEALAGLMSDLPGFQIVPVVMDSQDADALDKVFSEHRPHIVIHAGMRKFISMRKADDEEVARSNYIRTFNLARASARHGCDYFVLISSIKATRAGTFVSESLRVAEISLGRIFGQTPTRLIVTRVGNIIENRGGIVSWLNEQILERRPVRLPSETAKAFLLSKNAAARSILQALTTGSRISPGGLLLTSEPGVCLNFAEVARKIANFYGLELGVDIAVNFGQITEAFIYDEPSSVVPGGNREAATPKGILESDRIYRMIEKLVLEDTHELSEQEWYRRTEEIISLCGPALFSQPTSATIN